MQGGEPGPGMVMRLFHVRARKGCAATLLAKFATTSAAVVQDEPGNKGYFFGQGLEMDEDVVVFASLWADLEAIKRRFGESWQVSFLPEGYDALIEDCWVQHIDVGAGWCVRPDRAHR